MATISILANTVRPSVDHRFGAGTFSWQDPVHSWKAGPGEVMTVENLVAVTFTFLTVWMVVVIQLHFVLDTCRCF